jgi:plasmid stabilization system protein ParE
VRRPRIVLSDLAGADILDQADWYGEQAGAKLAQRWENATTSTMLQIAANPRAGAPCKFAALLLRDVRRVPVAGFPRHLVFINSGETRFSFCGSFMALATWKACSKRPTPAAPRLTIRDADQFSELQPALEAGTSSPLRNSGWTGTPLARATSAFSLSMSRLSQPTIESFTSPAAIKKIEGTLVSS